MLEDMNECLMNPVNYTEVSHPDFENIDLYKLDDLFLNYDDIPEA